MHFIIIIIIIILIGDTDGITLPGIDLMYTYGTMTHTKNIGQTSMPKTCKMLLVGSESIGLNLHRGPVRGYF